MGSLSTVGLWGGQGGQGQEDQDIQPWLWHCTKEQVNGVGVTMAEPN